MQAFDELVPVRHPLTSGVELHAVRAGKGPALVFIHGAMGDWRSWSAQWPAFTSAFDCISYSRRYSFPNQNTMPSPAHSALDEARDLLGLMDAMGLDKVILVGSSYGGFTALALALQATQRVRAVIAVEPPMMKYARITPQGRAVAETFRTQVIEPANAAFRAGDDLRGAQIMTGGINGGASPVLEGEAMKRRLQNLRAMKMLALSSDEFPLLPAQALSALKMPVLLLSGARTEPVHRFTFDNLIRLMPNAQHARVEGAGHGVTREQPERFNRIALEFLARTLGRPASS